MGRKSSNLTGQRFGRLVALSPTNTRRRKYVVWKMLCDCGSTCLVVSHDLVHGRTRSCGCLRAEILRKNQGHTGRPIHGHYYKPEHRCWYGMIRRCTRPSTKGYEYYGGRGIAVCDRWLNSFETFFADMGKKPSPTHSIDRIDPNGNYEPTNCRWATPLEQRHNRRPKESENYNDNSTESTASTSSTVAQPN